MPSPIATFTPSLMPAATLEALFVGRELILADLVERATDALTTDIRAHRMVVGPRGAGKTHLLSLASARIAAARPDAVIAWLSEDPWDIGGYEDFLRSILVSATRRLADPIQPAAARRLEADELEEAMKRLAADKGAIVVLAENFDQILTTIDHDGQRRLRGFLENTRSILLLVTATRLSASVQEQSKPFYGFFSTVELEPFSVAEATEMLHKIALHRGDQTLADRLANPPMTDQYRLQAIDALAGGQPRVWAVFGVALTLDGLDNLAELLLSRFDDLTPYYQEQLWRLSAQERKVVRTIADVDRALAVNELADLLGSDPRSISKTITTLRRSGWIIEVKSPVAGGDKRKTYYELAEPLARLAFQIKDNRGEPVPLLVSFLSLWFSRDEIEARTKEFDSDATRAYLNAAISSDGQIATQALALGFGGSPRSTIPDALLFDVADALRAGSAGDPAPLMALPSTVRRVLFQAIREGGLEATWQSSITLSSRTPQWITRAERLVSEGTDDLRNRLILAGVLAVSGRLIEAAALFSQLAFDQRATIGPDHPDTLSTRANLAAILAISGQTQRALELFRELLSDEIRILGTDHPSTLTTRSNIANWTAASGDLQRALELSQQVLADRLRVLGPEHPSTLTTLNNVAGLLGRAGDPVRALELFRTLLPTRERVLGPTHPDVLSTRINIATWTAETGEMHRGLELFQHLLPDMERMLGLAHPTTMLTRFYIAHWTARTGNPTEAAALLHNVLADQQRILGPDHPNTVETLREIAQLSQLADLDPSPLGRECQPSA